LRSFALNDVEIDSHPRERGKDVGKQDHSVGLKSLERLHRDLVREIGVLGTLPETGVFIAEISVDLHVTTRLSHHPHGGTLYRFTACSAQ
jgi:hypothetical protein